MVFCTIYNIYSTEYYTDYILPVFFSKSCL